MKHLFIVNPIAGGRDATNEVTAKVKDAFQNRSDEYEIYVTKAPMDAAEKIKRRPRTGKSCGSTAAAETGPSTNVSAARHCSTMLPSAPSLPGPETISAVCSARTRSSSATSMR